MGKIKEVKFAPLDNLFFEAYTIEEKMDEMYTRITKPTKENKSPKLKMKIPMKKENILCKVFDQKKIEFNLSLKLFL